MIAGRWIVLGRLSALAMVAWLLYMLYYGMGYRASGWLGLPVPVLLGFTWYCHFQAERLGDRS